MSEVAVWLLVFLPHIGNSNSNHPAVFAERFLSAKECERVGATVLASAGASKDHWPYFLLKYRCVEARVAVPK